jgi:beta-phosphoglucomutase-like phosphatase (HAD superfamily)
MLIFEKEMKAIMELKNKINQKLISYLENNRFTNFDLKSVIFDMDGVLYDSMPAHDKSWKQTIEELGLKYEPFEFYLQEGRIGKSTINDIFQRNLQRDATVEEENNIYSRKSELFQQYNTNGILPHADDLLNLVKEKKLTPVLVTGSGQPSLLDKLDHHFPGIFNPDTMVTAFNVTKGKPDPEPYIMGLEKGNNLLPNQAIVIENAPLGIKSAVGAGIFTIAVNTGPLQDKVLTDAGAALVFHSIKELYENFNLILDNINKINL